MQTDILIMRIIMGALIFSALCTIAASAQTTSVIQGRVRVHGTIIRNGVASPDSAAGIVVRAITPSGSVESKTDSNGFFAISDVPSGYVKLEITNRIAVSLTSGICLPPGARIIVDLSVTGGGSLPEINAVERDFEASVRRSNGILAKTPAECAMVTRIDIDRSGWISTVLLADGTTIAGGGFTEAQATPQHSSLNQCLCGPDGRRHGMSHITADDKMGRRVFNELIADVEASGLFDSPDAVPSSREIAGALYTITVYKGGHATSISARALPDAQLSTRDSRTVLLFMQLLGIMSQMGMNTIT